MDERAEEYVFAGWKVGEEIGRGTFATVYALTKGEMSRALKVVRLLSNLEGTEEEREAQLNRKMQEAENEIRVNYFVSGNTNVVNYHEHEFVYVWNEDHTRKEGLILRIMMERMDETLQDRLAAGQIFDEGQVIRLGKDICNALVVCHSRQILHRDIKPANIFVDRNFTCKLGDFGIAKVLGDSSVAFTHTGTQAYVAPEQWNNQPYYMQADIYSVGLILYQLMNNNRLPFAENGVNVESVARRIRGETFGPPENGSMQLKAIIMKACSYDPSLRYQTAEEMLRELEQIGRDASGGEKAKEEQADLFGTEDANKKGKQERGYPDRKRSRRQEISREKTDGLDFKGEHQEIRFTRFLPKKKAKQQFALSFAGRLTAALFCIPAVAATAVLFIFIQRETDIFAASGMIILELVQKLFEEIGIF